jgi:formamidopyrimidine-DNA glycosylase
VPELPEVEIVRRDLGRLYLGARLERLSISGIRTVRRHAPELLSRLEGQILVDVGRHGKYLLLRWGDGEVLVMHLRMSGQLLAAEAGAPSMVHTHAVFSFETAGELHFVDPRTFGELFVAGGAAEEGPRTARDGACPSNGALARPAELAHLGPDALEATPAHLAVTLAGRRAPVKSLLVDQRVVAGIGNIYADEICSDARVRPDRAGGSLGRSEVGRLAAATRSVLDAAIVARGSTLGDQQYRDVLGETGLYQLQHKVYGRAGLPCGTCGRPIERARMGAKSAYFCPRCQR